MTGQGSVAEWPIKAVILDGDDTLWRDAVFFLHLEESLTRLAQARGVSMAMIREVKAQEFASKAPGEEGFVRAVEQVARRLDLTPAQSVELSRSIAEFRAHPIELVPGVEDALDRLSHLRLILVTRGVVQEQERKVRLSGLGDRFERIFIVERKDAATYSGVSRTMGLKTRDTVSIGNSIRHDILPPVRAGAYAIWFNWRENHYGANAKLPACVPEVGAWMDLTPTQVELE